MPELITGFSFVGKSMFDIYEYLQIKDPSSLSSGILNLSSGMSLILNSSSWYIRDSNRKIFDKAPFWKTAYEKIREKIFDLIPQPAPIPQPSATRNY